jgi:formylglycine-generating enzyme required for sulfatase activity
VTVPAPPPSRAAIGRADLLRALAVAPRDHLALESTATLWFGYRRKAVQVTIDSGIMIESTGPAGPAAMPKPGGFRVPLQMPFLSAIVSRESIGTDPASADAPPLPPLDDKELAGWSETRLVGYEDLVPAARLLPALRRQLDLARAGPLDAARLTQLLAEKSGLPARLPRRRLRRWHPDLVVVLDFSQRLWPYREDMHRLAERLRRLGGKSGVALRIVDRGPFGPWSDWVEEQSGSARKNRDAQPWIMPPSGTPVLLVGDLSLLLGEHSASAQHWTKFIRTLTQARLRPVALVPLGARQLGAAITRLLPVLRWSPDAPAQPARGHGAAQAPAGLNDLLAMIAVTRRVDPPLLRALRRINPVAPLDAGLEGAVWCHDDIEAGATARLRDDRAADYLRHFTDRLDADRQTGLDTLRHRHHAHLRAVLDHEETLLWHSHLGAPSAEAKVRVDAARDFLARLASTHARAVASGTPSPWLDVMRGIIDRADDVMHAKEHALFDQMRASVLPGAAPDQRCWLVEDAARSALILQAHPPGARQAPLGEVTGGGFRIRRSGQSGTLWLSPAGLPARLGRLDEGDEIVIETSRERLVVATIRRPRGALGWGRDQDGINVTSPVLGRHQRHWRNDELSFVRTDATASPTPPTSLTPPTRHDRARPGHPRRAAADTASGKGGGGSTWVAGTSPAMTIKEGNVAAEGVAPLGFGLEGEPDFAPYNIIGEAGTGAISFGMDVQFGVYTDLAIRTKHGEATQRLRWIEPGTFLMGSPEDEPERDDDEGPQHAVTLTRGFWLADTACTQGLWQAVTGKNPSHFKGDAQLPVQSVNWHDVQGFLRALDALLPGCRADLPSEAEWEYACRAGTVTPFSFGAGISPEQVNYNGNYHYADGPTGFYRERTVRVGSLPANGWGLYEMHGNVWEWCADGLRDYDGEAQEDPRGSAPAEQSARALRGGSWIARAGWARSAIRYASPPVGASDALGFRLCLRSSEKNPAEPASFRPGRPAEPAPGGRPPRGVARFRHRKTKKIGK